jgi:hypothetical protein
MHGAQNAGGAAHVVFHFVHLGTRLERNAASIEGDALADQNDRLVASLAALVGQDDQLSAAGA